MNRTETIGEYFRRVAAERGVSLRALAAYADLSPNTINNWARGVMEPTPKKLRQVAGVMRADVDWRHGTIIVIGKRDKQRSVRMGAATQRAVDRYLRLRDRSRVVPYLFASRTLGPWHAGGMQAVHARLAVELGIHLHPHRWRHTALQSMLDDGMDRESVRILAGHERLDTLRVYTRATDAARALEAHRKHSPMDRLLRGR